MTETFQNFYSSTARRKPQAFPSTQYRPLTSGVDNGFSDLQFSSFSTCYRIPWKAIALAFTLSVIGIILLLLGFMAFAGFVDIKYQDRVWPLISLGALMFIPGAYHLRIAYYAYTRQLGYTFQDIPEFD